MSKRGTILLAIGLLLVGLILGCVAGGFAVRFFTRRPVVGAAAGRFAPGFFGGQRVAPGMFPYNMQPMTPGGMPFYGQSGGFGGTPFYGPRRGFGGAPSFGARRGFERRPFNRRGRMSRRSFFGGNFANGIAVTSIEPNSPADKAGLKAGDVITTVAGTKIDQSHSFTSLLQSHKPGEKIDLSVTRGGQNTTISITLGASPQNSNTAYLGIRYGPAPGPRPQRPRFR